MKHFLYGNKSEVSDIYDFLEDYDVPADRDVHHDQLRCSLFFDVHDGLGRSDEIGVLAITSVADLPPWIRIRASECGSVSSNLNSEAKGRNSL